MFVDDFLQFAEAEESSVLCMWKFVVEVRMQAVVVALVKNLIVN